MKIEKLTAAIAKGLIGKRVRYLRNCDRSTRGNSYREGTVTEYLRKHLEINGDYIHFSQIASIEIITQES